MDHIEVEIERPRTFPDCWALVVRHIPSELSNEFVVQEITKTIKSAISFSKIDYHRTRPTNDYRFGVSNAYEYEEVVSIGRIVIGHLLLPITAFIPGLKMTYCNQCWKLGHTRLQCKVEPRCRVCLEAWHYKHQCQKPMCCAQCNGNHSSLSMECMVVRNYRRALKEEVKIAFENGLLHQVNTVSKPEPLQQDILEYPIPKQTNGTHQAWSYQQGPPINSQKQHEQEQLSKVMTQLNDVLDITRRTENKIDNQASKLDILDKKSSINKQGIMVLANFMQQIINALSEKKRNKQQLQNVSDQLEEFKNDMMEKFNSISSEQQTTSNSLPPQPQSNNKTLTESSTMTTSVITTSIGHGKNKKVEQDQSMESTNDQ